MHDSWEGVAAWVLDRASGDAVELAHTLGLDVVAVPNQRAAGTLIGNTIAVRASLAPAYREHAIAHELGHWALRQTRTDDSEAGADYVAAALLMPWREVRRAHDWRDLLTGRCVTETSALLRAGEVQATPVAVVTPHAVYVRGPEDWQWPTADELRRASRAWPEIARKRRAYWF